MNGRDEKSEENSPCKWKTANRNKNDSCSKRQTNRKSKRAF